jgi:hypothetical protein
MVAGKMNRFTQTTDFGMTRIDETQTTIEAIRLRDYARLAVERSIGQRNTPTASSPSPAAQWVGRIRGVS